MNKDVVLKQNSVYKQNFLKEGACPQGLFWNNTLTQQLRFQRLFNQFLPFPNLTTIHDVGCGICDLHEFLISKNIHHIYSGTEIVQEMIDYSLKKFPDIKIQNRDLLSASDNEKYDVLVMSGTLNLLPEIPTQKWHEYIFLLIKKMYEMSNFGISFNFLTTYKTYTNPKLCYLDPLEMFDYCMKELSRFVTLDHAYPLYEATITVFKKDFLKNQYPEIELEKYFI